MLMHVLWTNIDSFWFSEQKKIVFVSTENAFKRKWPHSVCVCATEQTKWLSISSKKNFVAGLLRTFIQPLTQTNIYILCVSGCRLGGIFIFSSDSFFYFFFHFLRANYTFASVKLDQFWWCIPMWPSLLLMDETEKNFFFSSFTDCRTMFCGIYDFNFKQLRLWIIYHWQLGGIFMSFFLFTPPHPLTFELIQMKIFLISSANSFNEVKFVQKLWLDSFSDCCSSVVDVRAGGKGKNFRCETFQVW